MPGQFQATLELLSRDADTLNFRATVTKDKGQPDNAIVRIIGDGGGFTYYEALPVLDEDAPHDFSTPAPVAGEAFLWLWPDTTTPVSNTVTV